jgi:hypothetical protein
MAFNTKAGLAGGAQGFASGFSDALWKTLNYLKGRDESAADQKYRDEMLGLQKQGLAESAAERERRANVDEMTRNEDTRRWEAEQELENKRLAQQNSQFWGSRGKKQLTPDEIMEGYFQEGLKLAKTKFTGENAPEKILNWARTYALRRAGLPVGDEQQQEPEPAAAPPPTQAPAPQPTIRPGQPGYRESRPIFRAGAAIGQAGSNILNDITSIRDMNLRAREEAKRKQKERLQGSEDYGGFTR